MTRVLPPTYFLAALVLMIVLHLAAPLRAIVFWPWTLIGLMPLLAGILLNIAADRSFTRHRTTVNPFARSTSLVTVGVFRFTRNPMYLGMVLALAGTAILLGSLAPWIPVVALAVLLDRAFVAPEERRLAEIFTDQYEQYRRSVRRWL
jgi:protein-S-isoprenylcysteine O-methyltransferase Ste14